MALDQQALVEMFRQGFSPLADLSSGQLQMAIQQQQRDYTARQQQQQRAQQIQDHLAGLEAQNRMAVARDEAQNKAQFSRDDMLRTWHSLDQEAQNKARFDNDRTITADRTAAGLAQADMERYWRTLDKGDETLTDLRKVAAAQGLDTTEFKDPVSLTAALAGHVKKKTERLTNEATDLYLSLYDAEQALTEANAKTQLTEADRVKIVLPYALAAAGKDEKLKASLSKMTSADDIATELSLKVEMADGTIKRMGDALAVKENSLRSTHAAAIRSASVAADRINRQILDLPPGTTPDRAVLKKRGVTVAPPPPAAGVTASPAAQRFDSRKITELFVPGPGATAADAPVVVDAVPTSNALGGGYGAAGLIAQTAALSNPFTGPALVVKRGAQSLVDNRDAIFNAIASVVPRIGRAVIGQRGMDAVRSTTPVGPTSAPFMPASIGGLMRGIPPDEGVPVFRNLSAGHPQADPLAHINNLISRSQDPSVSGALRAIRAGAAPQNVAEALRAWIQANESPPDGMPTEAPVPAWQY